MGDRKTIEGEKYRCRLVKIESKKSQNWRNLWRHRETEKVKRSVSDRSDMKSTLKKEEARGVSIGRTPAASHSAGKKGGIRQKKTPIHTGTMHPCGSGGPGRDYRGVEPCRSRKLGGGEVKSEKESQRNTEGYCSATLVRDGGQGCARRYSEVTTMAIGTP